mmetsp:Transcript_8909/g.23292  ORF Transcript_8909/g.23292 Transcript_8909/m.23292 type:complete len:267 (-) Transcript_8909:970-1770(-)
MSFVGIPMYWMPMRPSGSRWRWSRRCGVARSACSRARSSRACTSTAWPRACPSSRASSLTMPAPPPQHAPRQSAPPQHTPAQHTAPRQTPPSPKAHRRRLLQNGKWRRSAPSSRRSTSVPSWARARSGSSFSHAARRTGGRVPSRRSTRRHRTCVPWRTRSASCVRPRPRWATAHRTSSRCMRPTRARSFTTWRWRLCRAVRSTRDSPRCERGTIQRRMPRRSSGRRSRGSHGCTPPASCIGTSSPRICSTSRRRRTRRSRLPTLG